MPPKVLQSNNPPAEDLADAQLRDIKNPRNYLRKKARRAKDSFTPECAPQVARMSIRIGDHTYSPSLTGFGNRTFAKPAMLSLSDRLIKPDEKFTDGKKVIAPTGAFSKVESNQDYSGNYYAHYGPIKPEYEMLESFTLYDVEVYVQQAIRRRVSLMFRNGYSFNGKNDRFVRYINKRVKQISYQMNVRWDNFMREILTCLSLCSNCFLLKVRDKDASGGQANDLNKNRVPVAAYVMIPPHTLFPFVDRGKIVKWRRYYNWGVKPWEDYNPEDIIHFKWDRKPGHIFGTPRHVAVRDDIFALRRLEENIELLFINHLFPLFHVAVGTDDAPAGYLPGGVPEVQAVKTLVEQMPKEGVFVTDHRVKVSAVGAEGESLDPTNILAHYKKRIFTGLGVSALDMGEGDTANRSTADNVSQALKDSIKYDLDVFSGQVTMFILKELFSEANFDISVQNAIADVTLEFAEVDIDSKMKEENQATQLYQNNGITHAEFRKRIGHKPMSDEEHNDTHYARHVVNLEREQADQAIRVAKESPRPTSGSKSKKKGGGKKGRSGRKTSSSKKSTPTRKATATKLRPTNQHGSNLGPTKAKSAAIEVGLYSHLTDSLEATQAAGIEKSWPKISSRAIDNFFARILTDGGSSYTNQVRMQIDQLKRKVGQTTDPDVLFSLIRSTLSRDCMESLNGNQKQPASPFSEPGSEGSPDQGAHQSQ